MCVCVCACVCVCFKMFGLIMFINDFCWFVYMLLIICGYLYIACLFLKL